MKVADKGMTVADEYKQELTRIHRSFGQYRRYIDNAPTFEELTGYQKPKRITKGSIRRLLKFEKIARAAGEHALSTKKKEADYVIENFKDMVESGYLHVVKTADFESSGFYSLLSVSGAERHVGVIYDALEAAIDKQGKIKVADGLKRFVAKKGKIIEHYAYAVIDTGDGGFNTNERWNHYSTSGSLGRQKFEDFTRDLIHAMGAPESYIDKILTEAGIK